MLEVYIAVLITYMPQPRFQRVDIDDPGILTGITHMCLELKLKYIVFVVAVWLAAGSVVSLLALDVQYEDELHDYPFELGCASESLIFKDRDVYAHNAVYCIYRNEIDYTITNISGYWYVVAPLSRAYKLVNNEWMKISNGTWIGVWGINLLPSGSYLSQTYRLGSHTSLHDVTLPAGTYLFTKTLFPTGVPAHINWGWEGFEYYPFVWTHLILEVP